MKKGRLEAFSDGVLAIIITIMVLELHVPEEHTLKALLAEMPLFISYTLSFMYVGIFWNNHHHLFMITEKVNGKILWYNLLLLFFISFIPFVTAWLDFNNLESISVALYGIVITLASFAFYLLKMEILKIHSEESLVRKSVSGNTKEFIGFALFILGIALSFVQPYIGISAYLIVALSWFIPEKRIENIIK
ncbi:MAG: TMEM175 family protein [Saprospiraceae bacterium]